MIKIITLLFVAICILSAKNTMAQTTLRIFDEVLFYDGYADTNVFLVPSPPAVKRLRTSLFTKKITDAELAQIGKTFSMKVLVKAACDNYDRGGHVSLALVPKGSKTYSLTDTAVKRLEIARFITPFMNKNKTPNTVPYDYEINNVASILKEKKITDKYDIWMELEIFGVPYAAQTQVTGCSGRTDVFYGTVDLITTGSSSIENNNVIISLGNQLNFNNYQAGATDIITKTIKTLTFKVGTTSFNTSIYLITSNHGAGTGGEEYNRRDHFVYLDGNQIFKYKPGFPTCEPYRVYNTQGNGIYGSSPRTDATWQSFSNWCPGAVIPTRIINIGTLLPGTHTFKIEVPDALFVGADGNFPLSVYIQGKTENTTGIDEVNTITEQTILYPNPAENEITVRSKEKVRGFAVFNSLGQKVGETNSRTINIAGLRQGVYCLKIQFENDITITKSFVK